MSWWERKHKKAHKGGIQEGFPSTNPTTGDKTLTQYDSNIVIDATSNTVTITLPAAPLDGQTYSISCLNSTFLADIDFNSKNFVTTSDNQTLIEGEVLSIIYDGTEWMPQ